MARPSSITRQTAEVRESIGAWHREGRTLDEILDALDAEFEVTISRSALHRHVKGLDKVMERIARSRQIAEATVRCFGKEPESMTARANIEITHAAISEILAAGEDDGSGVAKPMDAMLIAKAIEHLTKASRHDAEFITRIREEARKQVETEVRSRIKAMGSAGDLKKLSDDELEKKIAELAAG